MLLAVAVATAATATMLHLRQYFVHIIENISYLLRLFQMKLLLVTMIVVVLVAANAIDCIGLYRMSLRQSNRTVIKRQLTNNSTVFALI